MLKKSSFAVLVIAALIQPAFGGANTLLGPSSEFRRRTVQLAANARSRTRRAHCRGCGSRRAQASVICPPAPPARQSGRDRTICKNWRVRRRAFLASVAPAGVIARAGIHFLTGAKQVRRSSGRSTIAADLAVALAAGDVGCGLSALGKSGVRTSLSGFFGHATGAPAGVAIIADPRHAVSALTPSIVMDGEAEVASSTEA